MSKINFFPPSVDCSFTLDVYWFTVCVRNLVDNALTHGQAPVEVRAVVQENVLSLAVSDQGMIPKKELLRYLRPFARHYSHENLGLGLSLVRTIVEQMGGDFEVKACPTTMIIKLENVIVKE
jgi:signal transduction histidine kinase